MASRAARRKRDAADADDPEGLGVLRSASVSRLTLEKYKERLRDIERVASTSPDLRAQTRRGEFDAALAAWMEHEYLRG